MLEWSDLRRGLSTLFKKAGPIARALGTLVRYGEDDCLSLGAMLERTASKYPHEIALKFEDQAITYEAFNRWVNRLAHVLIRAGLTRGAAVAVFMDSRPAQLAVVAAIAKAGGIASMINSHQRREVLLHSLNACKPAFCVIGAELATHFEEVRPAIQGLRDRALYLVRDRGGEEVPSAYIDLEASAAGQSSLNPATTAKVQLGDGCFHIFTSGTTGLPKASILSHNRWVRAGAVFNHVCIGLRQGDTLYAPLPLYHNQALTLGWSIAVTAGAALAIRRKFSVHAFWDDCRRVGASAFVYIGEIPRYLLNQPKSPADRDHSVRKIIGVGLRPELWQDFKERFGIEEIYELYAASEINVAFLNAMNLDGTVGFCPLPWALVKFDVDAGEPVRNRKGRLIRVGKGETGLLITKVTERFKFEGYTDRAATERKLFHEVFRRGDTWYNSGDLMRHIGFGHLQFVDRVGDTFRWKSENVSTSEVELVLNQLEGVAESMVYGVHIPGCEGRAGMAAMVPADPAGTMDLEAVLAHVRKALPSYAIPVFIRVTRSLDVTVTFKHRKVDARKEGYDPARVNDPLFVLLPGAAEYCRVTSELHADIVAGRIRF